MLPAIPRPRAGLGPGREGSVSDDDRHGEEERESGELPTESVNSFNAALRCVRHSMAA